MTPPLMTRLRGIAVLWVNNLYVVVRNDSPIRSVADLKGRRIGVLFRGTAGEYIARIVLGTYGLSYTDVTPKFSGENTMLRDLSNRNIEAAFFGYPFMSDAFVKADKAVGLRLLSLDPETHRLRGEYPFLRRVIVPPGHLRHQTLPVDTVGAEALLICRDDLSEDTAYALTKELFRSLPTLASCSPRGRPHRPRSRARDLDPSPSRRGSLLSRARDSPMRGHGPVDSVSGWAATQLLSLRSLGSVYSRESHPRHWLVLAVIASVVCVATVALVLLGFIAIREWRRATEQLGQQRTAEALALVSSAIDRDMKGAWATLIAPLNPLTTEDTPPYDLLQPVAKTFARYPYPESLIVWKASDKPAGTTYVFNRADRTPPWQAAPTPSGPFPVVILQQPPELEHVASDLYHLTSGDTFACRNVSVGGESYQIVAHLFYGEPTHRRVTQFFALLINMKWIRQFYFEPIVTQVAKIGGSLDTLAFRVFDEHDQLVTHSKEPRAGAPTLSRSFPLMFCDRTLLPFLPEAAPTFPEWSVRVSLADTDAFLAVTDSAWSMWVLLVVSASASMISLFLIMRAIRASEALTAMKSEFVATVTHELKTPLALFHLVGDTLSRNRYNSPETIREYAGLLSKEAAHLGRLIDHLLMYAKYSTHGPGRTTLLPL